MTRKSGIRRLAVIGSVVAAATLILSACTADGTDGGGGNTANPSDDLTIVMVTHGSVNDPAWSVVKRGADDAAAALGVTLDYQAPQTGNAVEQGRLVSASIAKNPAGVAVTIPDPDALSGPIEEVVAAGIPVIAINIGLDDWEELGAIGFIGADLRGSGYAAGERLAESGVTRGLCVNHAASAIVLEQMCDGFIEALEANGATGTRVAVDGSNPGDAQRSIEGVLTQDTAIDGIFTLGVLGFEPAQGAITATRPDIKIGTFDIPEVVLTAVKDGTAEFGIDQQLYLQGYMSVQALAQNARYGLHPYGHVSTGPAFVTSENAEQVLQLTTDGVR